MTLKEAKDVLKKEFAVIGFHKSTEPFEFDDSNWFGYEKPAVLEAFRVLAKEGYYITISGHDYDMRKKRLQKEYEENTKAPGSAENRIKEDSGINPALSEAASQFNDALLDEQAKEIESLRGKCKKLVDIIDSVRDKLRKLKAENRRIKDSDLNLEGLIYATRELEEKNKKIEKLTEENECLKDQVAVLYACKENNEKYNLKQIKRLGKEIARLNKIIHDKDAVLSDVAEELRLSKIREKNLTEVGQKYMKENEELREKLPGEAKRVEMVRNASKEYCDYGVAANEFIKELASLYVLANNKGIINDEMLERCKNYQTYGFPANCNRETKKEINDIASGKAKVVGADNAEEGADLTGVIIIKS